MAIVNRSLDVSEQLMSVPYAFAGQGTTLLSNGVSLLVGSVPFPCTIKSVAQSVNGVSGVPLVDFFVRRTSTAGATVFSIGISGMVGSTFRVGYSGLVPEGSTLLNLSAGDELYIRNVTANTAIEKLLLSIVVQKTQDILSYS